MEVNPETATSLIGDASNPQVAVTDAKRSARGLLVEWSNGQDHWVRRLVGEILSSSAAPTDETLGVVVGALLAEKNLTDVAAAPVPKLVLEESSEVALETLVLDKLSDLTGVNALAPSQTIEFNPGLTVLFGENAAGKTGYARVLKQLAAVRTAETILPNVHDPTAPGTLGARIEYRLGASTAILDWHGESGVPPFTHMAIFDSPCVRLHVDEALSYIYTPSDLALFPLVTEAIGAVRTALVAAAADRRPTGNALLSRFIRGTVPYAIIETLGASTDMDRVRGFARVPAEEAVSLPELESKVSALQGDAGDARLSVARSRRDLHARLKAFADTLSAFDDETYNASVTGAGEADLEYERLRQALLEPDQEVAADAWQRFILDGDSLREHLEMHEYPAPGDSCLYCKQSLSEDALALLRRYRDFANDQARKRADSAREAARTAARKLTAVEVDGLREAVSAQSQSDSDDSALTAATALLDVFAPQLASARRLDVVAWVGIADAARVVSDQARARREAAESLVTDLSTKAGERAEALATAVAARDDLKDRVELQRLLPTIENHVASARWADQASQVEGRFPALLRSLTETAKEASEQLLNADFEKRFRAECGALRAPAVELDFPGRQGQSARRKSVAATGRPSDVLSEGEQKVIAIADFLAEASLRLSPSPVIFDDPVNSLDFRRIREVAARIAMLARERQVIVFTHSIWLATELLSHFESDRQLCSYFGIVDDGAKGIVAPGTHPRWDTVSQTRGRINSLIQAAEAASGEVREALIEQAYSMIRSWCEVVVETELLAGVTQRYQAHVMMTALPKIKGAHLASAVGVILPIFEKACRIMEGHSQPLETLAIRPSLSELRQDWSGIQAARQAYKDAS